MAHQKENSIMQKRRPVGRICVLVCLWVVLVISGCMGEDNLVEGELVAEPFIVSDENPAFQMSAKDGHLMVSLSQENGDSVSMVLIQVPNYSGAAFADTDSSGHRHGVRPGATLD